MNSLPLNFRTAGEHLSKLCQTKSITKEELRPLIEELQQAFSDSFLNYTAENPGHWSHPNESWQGHPDRPCDGMPVIMAFLEAERMLGIDPVRRDWVRRYFQFLAAVLPALEREDRIIAAGGAQFAAGFFPDEPVFLTLQKAFADSLL